jgi:ribonuclease D
MMDAHRGLLATGAEISQLAEKLDSERIIAFDTEFIREKTFFPVVEIIQIATAKESWLIDARAFKELPPEQCGPALAPLISVFQDSRILKVAHAAQGDQECLYTSFGIVAKPVFDTAVSASLCGFGDGVGLGNLLKSALGVSIKKGHARTNWSVRPLPEQLEEYAHVDVEFLVELAERLLAKLDQLGRRAWAMELSAKSEDTRQYELDPEDIALKLARGGRFDKRGYAALVELVRWREGRVRQLDLPRRWVADDNVLMDLAHVRPRDVAHLSAFRGLNKGELRNSGEAILAALKKASEMQDIVLPRLPKPEIPSPSESQVLELIKCYVGMLADRHQVAIRHLVSSSQLLPLLRSGAKDPQELARRELLSSAAAALIGHEVIAFLRGKRALSVNDAEVRVVELE